MINAYDHALILSPILKQEIPQGQRHFIFM